MINSTQNHNASKYITLTSDNFDAEVRNSTIPVVVDFWAPWCGPCRVMSPIVTKLAEDFAGTVKVGKLNIDDYEQLATQYHIEAIPTLIFFQHGQEIDRLAGVVSLQTLTEKVNTLLQSTRQAA